MGKPNDKTAEAVQSPIKTEVKPVEAGQSETNKPADPTEPVSTQENGLIKSGFIKVKVKDFRGSFGNTFFDDNCIAEISEADLNTLRQHFPGVEVEELN